MRAHYAFQIESQQTFARHCDYKHSVKYLKMNNFWCELHINLDSLNVSIEFNHFKGILLHHFFVLGTRAQTTIFFGYTHFMHSLPSHKENKMTHIFTWTNDRNKRKGKTPVALNLLLPIWHMAFKMIISAMLWLFRLNCVRVYGFDVVVFFFGGNLLKKIFSLARLTKVRHKRKKNRLFASQFLLNDFPIFYLRLNFTSGKIVLFFVIFFFFCFCQSNRDLLFLKLEVHFAVTRATQST